MKVTCPPLLITILKSREISKNLYKSPDTGMDFSNQTKTTEKNAPTEKSEDFCLTFMNSMEDGRRNPGSRPWTFKTRENPESRPSTFADCEYQLREVCGEPAISLQSCRLLGGALWRACNLTSFSPCLIGLVVYLFASRHNGPRFKSPGGNVCETGIPL